ncbi:MAG: AraC family transcriptional regulator ligand-binding domain-containing protein [Bacteroidia bacterium]
MQFLVLLSMSFNGRFVLSIIQFAELQGLPKAPLLELLGHSEMYLCAESTRVENEDYDRLMENIIIQSGDEHFGLHMGRHMSLSAAGLIFQIVQSSRTVREALHYCAEFAALGCKSLPITIEDNHDEVHLIFTPQGGWETRSPVSLEQTLNGVLVFSLREFHSLTLYKHNPLGIHLSRSGADAGYLEGMFGCPVELAAEDDRIILSRAQVDLPVVTSDYRLLNVLVQYANEKVASLGIGEKEFFSKVKTSILNMVKPQFPTITQVADQLQLSVRTLQRKLKAEGFTFQDVIEQLRQEFAKDYLSRPELSIGEIAFLLSYAEASAFVRAFKRWTGKTPGDWRKDAVA